MFGGLELKKPGTENNKKEQDAAAASKAAPSGGLGFGSSAFSFLQSSTETGNESAPAPATNGGGSSAFSFLSATSGVTADNEKSGSVTTTTLGVEGLGGSSGFSFLSTTPAAPPPPVAPTESTAAEGGGDADDTGAADSSLSSFRFLSGGGGGTPASDGRNDIAAASQAGESRPVPQSPEGGGSMFSFLSGGTTSTSAAAKSEDAPSASRAAPSSLPSPSNAAMGTSMTSTSDHGTFSPPSLPDIPPSSRSHMPAGSGMEFVGAVTAASKKPGIKKKSRSKRVGIGAAAGSGGGGGGGGGVAISAMGAPTPAETQQQHPQQQYGADSTTPTASSASHRVEHGAEEGHMGGGESASGSPQTSVREEAEEAARRTQQWLEEKARADAMRTLSSSSGVGADGGNDEDDSSIGGGAGRGGGFVPPNMPDAPSSPTDETYVAAKAAAQEAKMMASAATGPAHPSRPFGSGRFMGGIFGRAFKSGNNHGSNENSSHGGSSPSLPRDRQTSSSSTHSHNSSTAADENKTAPVNDAVAKLQRAQEEVKRAAAERHLATLKRQQEREEEERIAREQKEEEMRRAKEKAAEEERQKRLAEEERQRKIAEEEEAKRRAPEEQFKRILSNFEQASRSATVRVAELRKQRSKLLEERLAAEKHVRLATQQISQAEAQQMVAAEQEDFDLADRLSAVIDKQTQEKEEHESILESIGSAVAQLDKQKDDVVQGVTACFVDVQEKLSLFKKEQESVEREDGSEAMEKFAATSRLLSAENERLSSDLKHLERDEKLVREERKDLEGIISEQTSEAEKLRDEARTKLDVVTEEIEELRKLLAAKEAVAAELTTELASHEASIAKVRVKFTRQLTRVQKKENAVKENRAEWEAEKASFEHMKEKHEANVKAHSESLLALDKMMSRLQQEISSAGKLRKIVAKEVVFENGGGTGSDTCDEELKKLQAEVLKCEAAVDEANQLLMAANAAVESLENEVKEIDERVPLLEAEKKRAASKRDFRVAGKASKAVKEALARKERCQEELSGEAKERQKVAEKELEKAENELEEKRTVAHHKEKETGVLRMASLAKKIKRLQNTKNELFEQSDDSEDGARVVAVGALVLEGEISALKMEGEALGAKFGGWESIIDDMDDASVSSEEASISDHEEDKNDTVDDDFKARNSGEVSGKQDKKETETQESEKQPSQREAETDLAESFHEKVSETISEDKIEKYKELMRRLKEAEQALEDAVAAEDFDKAAELDELFQELQAEIEALGPLDELENISKEFDNVDESAGAAFPVSGGKTGDAVRAERQGPKESEKSDGTADDKEGVPADSEKTDDSDVVGTPGAGKIDNTSQALENGGLVPSNGRKQDDTKDDGELAKCGLQDAVEEGAQNEEA